jgi:hypothetical protein
MGFLELLPLLLSRSADAVGRIDTSTFCSSYSEDRAAGHYMGFNGPWCARHVFGSWSDW